eukprot:Nitzschia sp. Nitz4//scaffold155_size52807//3660//7830//NITZ4_006790-RA/size52807-processed-gene-0.13-mRNA-1//-1//CDS//3329537351//3307//frame0
MSSSSLTLAKRHAGVCQGSLIKAVEQSAEISKAATSSYLMSSSAPVKVSEYCLLVGVRLTCYESWLAMDKGHPPTAIYSIVGASAVSNSSDASFRLVTNQGTHLWCCPPSSRCRDLWLGALNAGLERHFSSNDPGETLPMLKPVKPQYHKQHMRNPPNYCQSCGKLEKPDFQLLHACTPLSQYGMESRMNLCPRCSVSQGVLEHVRWMQELNTAQHQEQAALSKARMAILKALDPKNDQISDSQPTTHLPLTPHSHHVLSGVLSSPQCNNFCRLSPTLERLSISFSRGDVGCSELVELLENAIGIRDEDMRKLKQQAFRFNGDMGTALKLLADNALPNVSQDDDDDATMDYAAHQNATELVECILEFFLDLLEEGELQSVAFFWPQMLNIHLQMLPPQDTVSLRRIELMEDFLLTVATQHSIQLAIDLIWSHTADLEDAKATPPKAVCTKRRYAVLRFLCELESLLFDHEMGWGGGTVTVGSFMGASPHQQSLLKSGMRSIQDYRMSHSVRLSRSRRVEKLLKEQQRKACNGNSGDGDLPGESPEEMAKEALRIAKNADYLSTHLVFTKRLGDIAGRLFYQPVEERKNILAAELAKLNASGSMGGDPLNRVKRDGFHKRVVRLPMNEGHVFRSKERTPVLLLMETLDEAEETQGRKRTLTPFSDTRPTKPDLEEEEKEEPPETKPTETNEIISEPEPETKEIIEELSDVCIGEEPAAKTPNSESFDTTDGSTTPKTERATDNIENVDDPTPTRHALRRFDSPKGAPKITTPSTDKESVEALVTNVVAKQLQMPSLAVPSPVGEADEGSLPVVPDVVLEQNGATSNVTSTTPDQPVKAAKMSALGSGGDSSTLSKTSDTRREVLNSLMRKGMSGSHSLAAGAATAMQRSLQDLERRRAVELLLTGDEEEVANKDRHELLTLGIRSISRDDLIETETDETKEDDEAMEAIRLLLIQYQVATGSLSMNDAAKVLAPHHRFRRGPNKRNEGTIMHFGREFPEIDAGDVDPRLIGCGTLPPAVLQALTLRKANVISNGELLELVKKDLEFVKNASGEVEAHKDKLNEDSAFWGRFAFGERWAEKRSRIAASSPDAASPGWELSGVIVKANDDLRQEAFVMQLIELCQEAFDEAGLELWMLPYRILSTGRTTGIIEMVRNAMSFDALKKRPGYGRGGLREHLLRMTQHAADPGEAFKAAQINFVRSLAAYSLLSYLFLFKDRHNGNLLLDTAGHVIHIDFGFVFGVAPGGSFSLEISTPFKLTEEMIEVMDGLRSSLFSEFITLFCCGFLALQSHCNTFCTVVDITCKGSTFKCFEGRDSAEVVGKLRERFRPDLGKEETIAFCLDLIKAATQSYGTAQYDYFQYLSQGIAA